MAPIRDLAFAHAPEASDCSIPESATPLAEDLGQGHGSLAPDRNQAAEGQAHKEQAD